MTPKDGNTDTRQPAGAEGTADTGSPTTASETAHAGPESTSKPAEPAEPAASGPALPPLIPQEFRIYNRLAEQMDYFHAHFRQMYATLHTACATSRRPANMTLRQFLDEGLRLAHYLEMHHSIEETHLYPLLGRKMPEFRATTTTAAAAGPGSSGAGGSAGGRGKGKGKGKKHQRGGGGEEEECELIRQHRMIHEGMDEMVDYLRRCKDRECELELAVLKEKMEPWGEVLLKHLDQEVRDLGAENMRKYWTLQEMRAFPI